LNGAPQDNPNLNVHLVEPSDPESLRLLEGALAPGVRATAGDHPPADIHFLVSGRPTREQLEGCPSLRGVVIPWAGLPAGTRTLLQAFPKLKVYNLHYNATQTAEMAVTLLLAAAKWLVPYDQALRKRDWRPRYQEPPRAVMLAGRRVLILGFGHIGQHVGRVCQALGMNVTGVRRDPTAPRPPGLSAAVFGPDRLPALLPEADVLVITVPLTEQTRGLLDEAALNLLPDGALLVNVGRGEVVDERALYQALLSGKLGGAGLDVWYQYPRDEASRAGTAPSHYPLYELEQVVLSPHRAEAVQGRDAQRVEHLARLLNQLARGEPVDNQVSVLHGY